MTKEQETKIDKIVENMSDKEIENRIKQDEQEKAIEDLENLSEYGLCYTITEKIQENIKTALNMLKEKDKKIEYYKKQKDYDMQFRHELLEQIRCLNLDKDNKFAEIEQKNVELAEKNAELEKKDKIIDLMATFIDAQNTKMLEDEYTAIKNIYTIIGFDKDKEEIKQYFERDVKGC